MDLLLGGDRTSDDNYGSKKDLFLTLINCSSLECYLVILKGSFLKT